jgi:hypothetical protein
MEVVMRSIGSIKPYENNPRDNDPAVDAVAASIKGFGTDEERWAAVPGYEGLYEVSTHGRVRRSSKSRMAPAGHVLKQRPTWDGYLKSVLSKRRRPWHVKTHRLVALAFLGAPPFPGAHVAHFDGDKTNNHLSNLRWATAKENEADKRRHGRARAAQPGEQHHMAKLTVALVQTLRRRAASGEPVAPLARSLGVNVLTAHDAIYGTTWKCVTDPAPLPRKGKKTA